MGLEHVVYFLQPAPTAQASAIFWDLARLDPDPSQSQNQACLIDSF